MNLNQKIQSFLNEHKTARKRLSATALLSLLIALSVVSSLIMPAISMTMASMKSNAGENDSISIITQATAGNPSYFEGTTMLDLLSADEWTASLMCNGDYFFEATNSGVTTNKEFPTNFDTVEVSAYINYVFKQDVSDKLVGSGPHLGWYLGNTDFKAKFEDEEGNIQDYGDVYDPAYTAGKAGTYVIEDGYVKVTLTDDYIAFVGREGGDGTIKGTLDFSGTLSASSDGDGNQSFNVGGEEVIVNFPDKYPTMNKTAAVGIDGKITWTVYINNIYNANLEGCAFSDSMLSNAVGDITVNPPDVATVTDKSIAFTDKSKNSQWITITYKTEITNADLEAGSTSNTANLKVGDKDIPASATATFSNPFTVDKYGSPDYTGGTYNGKINWSVKVKSNYGTSLDGYVIKDTLIPDSEWTLSSGSMSKNSDGNWVLDTDASEVTITYSAPATAGQTNSNTATLYNPSGNEAGKDTDDVPYDDISKLITVEKSGYVVNSNGTISWTIKVKNPYGLSLNGDTITDKMLSSAVGTVNISPSGSGTYSDNKVTLSGNAAEITIAYTTKITEAQLKANKAENDVTLKHGGSEITDDADVDIPDPFDVTKNGTPDYVSGTYGNQIKWKVTIKSNYNTSLDGYIISDEHLPTDTSEITVTGGTLTNADGKWTLSNTTGNTVTIEYYAAAVEGNNSNTVNLKYSDSSDADSAENEVTYQKKSDIIKLNKNNTIDTTDGVINWTIAITNQYGLDLNGYVLTDDMLSKATGGAVTIYPADAGSYAEGKVTLTDKTKGVSYITVKYSTPITEADLKNGSVSNTANLTDTDSATSDAIFTSPYFTMTKSGKPDYEGGSHDGKITWTIKIESKYGSSLDGYILTDTLKENGIEKDVDLSSAKVSPSGSIDSNGKLSGTNGANTIYITYTTDAVKSGATYNNGVELGYSDGTGIGDGVTGSSGDVQYKSEGDLVTLNKYGYYDKDAHAIRWTINVSLLGGSKDCTLTDSKFPDSKDKLSFSPDISSCATLNGDTLTIENSPSSYFTITYYEDVIDEVLAGTTVIENTVNKTTATVSVSNRKELTKSLNSNGYETIDSNGVVTRTLNWTANITLDGKFKDLIYTDNLKIDVTDANGTAITGDGSAHTITNEQLAAIVVKARTTQYGAEATLALGTDYVVTKTGNGFEVRFNESLDNVGYNYVTITYSTTATAGAVTTDKYPVKYVFGNGAAFDDKNADAGDFTLVKNNPVIETKLDLTATKNWQNDTYADRPDSIYIKVWYNTNKDGTWRTLRGSGTDYIYYGESRYDSASDYIIKIDKDAANNWQSSTLTGLYKEVALPEADGTRGSSTYYYYKIEEVNAVTDGSGNVTYETIANNSFETSNGIYEVTYSNNNGINYTGTAIVYNNFHRTTAITPVKQWAGDTGSGDGMLSVTMRLDYSIDGGATYYPVEVINGKYVFDFGTETAGTSVLTQNVSITGEWKGVKWDKLPTAMIVDGAVKYVSYRIVETAYTTSSETTPIESDRFAVKNGYYTIGRSGGSDNEGGQLLTITNTFNATESLSVKANKTWSGDESEEYSDNRPKAILVKLQQRSSANWQWVDYEAEAVKLDAANNWSYEWNVPNQSVDDNGVSADYTYRVVEVGYVKGDKTVEFTENQTSFAVSSEGKYTISYYNGSWGSNELAQSTGGTINVTNTFTPVSTIDITPQKKWVGDSNFVSTDRPTSITFTLQRKVGNGAWEYADANGNAVADKDAAHSVVMTSNENDTIETGWDGVSTTSWTAETISGLPDRVVVLGENGTYTEQICQYQFVETSYVLGGVSYDIPAESTKFSTANGAYKITANSTASSGILANINTFDESIGILKSALNKDGERINTITVDELEGYKHGDYYIFNWLVEYDCPDTNDQSKLAKITPVADKLPAGFTLCEEPSYYNAENPITTYGDTSSSIISPLETKNPLGNGDGYYLGPCIVWPEIYVATLKGEASIKGAWANPGTSPSKYYYDKENNTVYFGKPAITAVPSFVYSIKIKCSVLEDKIKEGSFSFSNNAERYDVENDGTGTPTGKTASATLKIFNPIDTKLINKTYEGRTNTPGEIKFKLNINPEGKNLSTGSTIDVQDIFNTLSYFDHDIGGGTTYDAASNWSNIDKLVDVLMSNIKLYEVDINGNKSELSASDYTLLFATGSETDSGALMKLTLPDEKHIIIEYTYKLIANENTPSVFNGCKSSTRVNGRYATMAPGLVPPAKDKIGFSNTASLKTESNYDDSTLEKNDYTVFKSSGTISTNVLPLIKKVNTADYSVDNLNAEILFAKYENGMWYYAESISTAKGSEGTITWDTAGYTGTKVPENPAVITISGTEELHAGLEQNVLYKIIEVGVPSGYEGSNLSLTSEEFKNLIINYLNNGNTFVNDTDYSVFLENFVSTHYYAYNSTVECPDGVDSGSVIHIMAGGDIEIPNNELIDITVNKNWINPQSAIENSEITVELYWSYEKSVTMPDEADMHLASAAELGIMDVNFTPEKTIKITKNEDGSLTASDASWKNLPNGKENKPIYYYIKETSYTIGGITYNWNDSSKSFESASGTGMYLPTYVGNAANTDTTIDVNNSYQLMLKKVWTNSKGEPLSKIPVDKVIVSIYGLTNEMEKELLFSDVEISAANNWQTDITNLLGSINLENYTSFVAEESAGTSLSEYVVSCVFNINKNTGEITVGNKDTKPTEASVTVNKVWSDSNAMHVRDTIEVTLYQSKNKLADLTDLGMKLQNVSKMQPVDEDDTQQYENVKLNASNDWTCTWIDLPLEDSETEEKYYYYVLETMTEKSEEDAQSNEITDGVIESHKYSAFYEITDQTASNTEFQISNNRKSITVQKQWLDEEDIDVSNVIDITSIELEVLKKVPTVPSEGIDVTTLGDSITEGYGTGFAGGYAPHLQTLLTNAGYTVNSMGKHGHSQHSIENMPDGEDYTTGEFRSGIFEKLSSDIGNEDADITCLMIGTNDIISNYQNNIDGRLEDLIIEIYDYMPDTALFVSTIPKFRFDSTTSGSYTWFSYYPERSAMSLSDFENYINNTVIAGYNAKIEALVKKLKKDGYDINFVDVYSVLNKDTEIVDDGCHPNAAGDQTIAGVWMAAIVEYYTQTSKVGDITLSAANNWTAAYDISSADTATEYYVDESNVPEGWKVSYDGQFQKMGSATPITVTNKRVIPKTSLSINKVWENDAADTSSRDLISLVLLQSTDMENWYEYEVEEWTPSKTEDLVDKDNKPYSEWVYSFEGLPAEDINGNQYYYKIVEDPLPGYTTKYNMNILEALDDGDAGEMMLTNTMGITLKLQKLWRDMNRNPEDSDLHKNDELTFKVYRSSNPDDVPVNVDLILDLNAEAVGVTEGNTVKVHANKAVTIGELSEEIQQYVEVTTENGGKDILIKGIKETSEPITITVTDGTDTKNITVTVTAFELSIDTDNGEFKVEAEGTANLSVTKGGADYTDVTYVSSDPNTLTVDANGKITGIKPGSATISVYDNAGSSEVPVLTQEVEVILPSTFSITGANEVTIGEDITLGIDKNYGSFTWTSLNEAYATVDQNGKVTGVAAGTVTIRATRNDGVYADYAVTVVNGDIFENDNVVVRVPVGETVTIKSATAMQSVYAANWDDSKYVTHAFTNGSNTISFTGVSAGQVTYTAHSSSDYGNSTTFTVIVYDKFSVSPATKTLAYGDTVTLTPNTTDAVTYTIKSGSNLIDISGNTVTAKSGTNGTAVIEAKNTVTGETATVTIEVVAEIPEVQTTFSGASTISIDNSKTISCIRVNLQHSGSNWEYVTVKLDGSDSNKAKFGYNGNPPLIMESKTCTNVNFAITDAQNGDVEITFIGNYQPSSISIESNGNVIPSGTVTVVYASASTSNLALYGASMATMLYGADAEEEESVEIKGQLVDTITLHGSTAWEGGKEWQATISNLEVYNPNGDPYYYWVIEEHTHKNYAISYLYKDEDDGTDYCINAEKADSDGIDITVANTKEEDEGVLMPSTGGEGTMKFYCTGGAMILLSVLAGSNRMRRRIKERRTK